MLENIKERNYANVCDQYQCQHLLPQNNNSNCFINLRNVSIVNKMSTKKKQLIGQ